MDNTLRVKIVFVLLSMVWYTGAYADTKSDIMIQLKGLTASITSIDISLSDYRSYKEQDVAPWQELNNEVARIGGWEMYMKELEQADTPADASATQSPPATKGATPPPKHSSH